MLQIRPAADRGHSKLDWLDSRFSFSFADYYDPEHTHFRSLRVINEDHIAPGGGFGMHPHRDMEIITYLLDGALEHRDNMGNRGVIHPGEIQKMSAGTGVLHSEFNPSPEAGAHLLQIWLIPDKKGIQPSYEQHTFEKGELDGQFHSIAGANGVISIQQDVELLAARLTAGQKATHRLAESRHVWLQLARGAGSVHGQSIKAGDGVAISKEPAVTFEASEPSEVLLFDLA